MINHLKINFQLTSCLIIKLPAVAFISEKKYTEIAGKKAQQNFDLPESSFLILFNIQGTFLFGGGVSH